MSTDVFIYGVGVISAFGTENEHFARAVDTSSVAVREITGFEVPEDSPGMGAELRDFKISRFFPSIKSYVDRCTALALKSGRNLIKQSVSDNGAASSAGFCFGSQFSCIETMKLYGLAGIGRGWRYAPPFLFIHSYANTPVAMLHIELGMKGYSNVFAGYEAAGWDSVADAVDAVSLGDADRIVAGAAEALGELRYAYHYYKGETGTLDEPDDGFIPGEGGSMLFISSESSSEFAAKNLCEPSFFAPVKIVMASALSKAGKIDYVFGAGELRKGQEVPVSLQKSEAVSLTGVFGDCGSANLPMSIAAFLLSREFPEGAQAAFLSPSPFQQSVIIVEKRYA